MDQDRAHVPQYASLGADRPVLVIGGGIAGMAMALRLREQDRQVVVIEADPLWRVYGAGISVTAPTYRAFKRLGVLDAVNALGFLVQQGARICRPDGGVIADLPTHQLEPGLPASGGIMRPELHRILSEKVLAAGVEVRLGRTVSALEDRGDHVHAVLDDGGEGDYDFAVAADGVFSPTRTMLFPEAPEPKYTGQFCFRLVADRPKEIDRHHFYMAGKVTAGLMPVSDDKMYMWLLWSSPEKVRIESGTGAGMLKGIMAPFGGILGDLRDGLDAATPVVVRPLEAMLLPLPWHKGRVVVMGDAVHATTPHLASGAGIALEDALVLGEALALERDPERAFEAFEARRWERCRMVVENSIEIGRLQQENAPPPVLQALIARSEAALAADT